MLAEYGEQVKVCLLIWNMRKHEKIIMSANVEGICVIAKQHNKNKHDAIKNCCSSHCHVPINALLV